MPQRLTAPRPHSPKAPRPQSLKASKPQSPKAPKPQRLLRRHNAHMRAFALLTVMLAGLAHPVLAQNSSPAAPAAPTAPAIDASKLGVSLSRIALGLKTAESREKQNPEGLKLEYSVQVYGTAPRIELFPDTDLAGGQVPDSAPTHNQVIDFLTPKAYSAPEVPVSAFAMWLAEWMWQKSKKTKCEEEIANYRAMVMQGMNVSAPRCTQ